MSVFSARHGTRHGLAAIALLAAVGSTGCTQLRSHQGYVVDVDLVNAIQPGVDNC